MLWPFAICPTEIRLSLKLGTTGAGTNRGRFPCVSCSLPVCVLCNVFHSSVRNGLRPRQADVFASDGDDLYAFDKRHSRAAVNHTTWHVGIEGIRDWAIYSCRSYFLSSTTESSIHGYRNCIVVSFSALPACDRAETWACSALIYSAWEYL